jgi:DNA-binding NarL/FixJ family response regulator
MRLSCLIVDDNPGFLTAAKRLLECEGVDVLGVASTGDEALERVRELRPDVALVDIELNGESGFDVVRRLASLPEGAQPVILISTHSGHDFADLISSSTALGFVSKAELSADAIEELVCAQ